MNKNTLILLFLLTSFITTGQIKSSGSYTPIGDTEILYRTNDADNGDGANDGTFFVNGLSVVVGQGVSLTFNGTMETGSAYNIATTIYNSGGSFCGVTAFLYNKTDATSLTTPTDSNLLGGNIDALTINYTAVATDEGDVLELRFVRDDDGNTSRDFSVDFINLNGTVVNDAGTFGVWNPTGDVLLIGKTDDADNGDGVADGNLYVDGQSAVVGQGTIYVLDKVAVSGIEYTINSTIFNPNGSFCGVTTGLYNKTDNTLLSTLQDSNLGGGSSDTFTLTYTTTATDVGDVLEVRYTRDDDGNTARNFSVDVLNINGFAVNTDVNMWDGSSNTNWISTSNWTKNSIPTATEGVVIPSGTPNSLIILSSTSAVAGDFTVLSGATVNIEAGGSIIVNETSSGNITYNRDLSFVAGNDKGWHLIASPVSGETYDNAYATAQSLATSGTKRGLGFYTTATDNWSYLEDNDSNAGTFTTGIGYTMKRASTGPVNFTGTINTEDVNNIVISTAFNGFNALGNPYASYINSKTFLEDGDNATNLTQQIWVWNQDNAGGGASAGYEVKVAGDAFIVAPGQGFFVKAIAGTSVNFAESNQTGNADTFLKSSRTEVKLLISDGTQSRFAKLYYLNNATTGFDNGWEGETFGGVKNSLDVFTNLVADNQGRSYQVQSLPISDMETTVVPLGIVAEAGKEITFTSQTLNLPSGLKVLIEDRVNNTFTRLDKAGSSYKITLSEAINDIGRFYLHTSTANALSVDDLNLDNISIYKSNATTLRIVGLSQGNSKISLHNILGKKVMSKSFISTGVKDITLSNLAKGIYIVKLNNNNNIVSKKIILE
jgi:hypothetical protein